MEWGGKAIFTIGKIWPSFDIPAFVVRSANGNEYVPPLTLALTPCFSWVVNDVSEGPNRFSGFLQETIKPLKRLCYRTRLGTSLKRGVIEMEYEAAALDAYVALAVTFGV